MQTNMIVSRKGVGGDPDIDPKMLNSLFWGPPHGTSNCGKPPYGFPEFQRTAVFAGPLWGLSVSLGSVGFRSGNALQAGEGTSVKRHAR